MLRHAGGVGNEAEVEGRGVVVLHGQLVVGVVLVHQADLLDGIARLVELPEDVQHVLGDVVVDDHFALARLAVQVHVQHVEVAQVLARQGAFVLEGLALDALKDLVGDRADVKVPVRGRGFLRHRQRARQQGEDQQDGR